MAKAYLFVKCGYEGCSVGDVIYLSKKVAEEELAEQQKNPESTYYNHPKLDDHWFVDEFELDERRD